VSFAAITLCVTSHRVFIVAVVTSLSTQPGNFWIHLRIDTPSFPRKFSEPPPSLPSISETKEFFSSPAVSRTALGPTKPPIQWVPGTLSLGLRLPGREANHSPPSNVEVKNAWSYTSIPQYAFMAWCSVKIQGHLYLYIIIIISHHLYL
jgi:hypothetical protein